MESQVVFVARVSSVGAARAGLMSRNKVSGCMLFVCLWNQILRQDDYHTGGYY